MKFTEEERLEKILFKEGVAGEGNPAVAALCELMGLRATEIMGKLLMETDQGEIARLQGAAQELKRWSGYPAELAAKREWLEGEKPTE